MPGITFWIVQEWSFRAGDLGVEMIFSAASTVIMNTVLPRGVLSQTVSVFLSRACISSLRVQI